MTEINVQEWKYKNLSQVEQIFDWCIIMYNDCIVTMWKYVKKMEIFEITHTIPDFKI